MNSKKINHKKSQKAFSFHNDNWLADLVTDELIKHDFDPNKEADFFSKLPEKMHKCIEKVTQLLFDDLKKRKDGMVLEYYLIDQGFNSRIFQRYQEPFSLMQMLYVITIESITQFKNDCDKLFEKNNQYLYCAILLIHARCCQIFGEIFSLLKNGYPDGAMARWRSLHELVVISYYIKDKGEETAKKYLDHIVIENYKLMENHKIAIKEGYLKEKPLSAKEFKKLSLEKDKLLEKYGKKFNADYGWSDETNFREIQNKVNINQLKPYYKWSHSFIHSGSKGTVQKLGLIDISNTNQILLIGPSNYGFTEPGNLAAISLHQVSVVALSLNPTIFSNCISNIMSLIVEEIGISLFKVQNHILEEEGL